MRSAQGEGAGRGSQRDRHAVKAEARLKQPPSERREMSIAPPLPARAPAPGAVEKEAEPPRVGWVQRFSAAALIVLPLVAVVWAGLRYWRHGLGWLDLGLAVGLYLVTGFGLTAGFHRLFSHRSFKARRWLKVALAVAGSMGIEGSLLTWVSQHRRHHAFSDRPGDPHSPQLHGDGFQGVWRGLLHAHVGWFFVSNPSHPERWSPDILADRDLMLVSRTATLWSVVSLAIPFAVGWAATGKLHDGVLTLVWAGGVRIALLHHVSFGVNSLGHMFGRRPFLTRDQSRNFGALALLSLGDAWHNGHHAFPASARHGVNRGEIDAAAGLISLFERMGWATEVRRLSLDRMSTRRRAA
jgi:stearoyl-CoA desaturase (delta-9 desaturase)